MWSSVSIIIDGLFKGFTAVAKNPLVTKMLIFTTFVGLITYVISFIKSLVAPYLVSNSVLAVAGYFGALDGLSLYITIVVAGFGVKQILAFIRT